MSETHYKINIKNEKMIKEDIDKEDLDEAANLMIKLQTIGFCMSDLKSFFMLFIKYKKANVKNAFALVIMTAKAKKIVDSKIPRA